MAGVRNDNLSNVLETDILNSQSVIKPLVWKRFIDDIFFTLERIAEMK